MNLVLLIPELQAMRSLNCMNLYVDCVQFPKLRIDFSGRMTISVDFMFRLFCLCNGECLLDCSVIYVDVCGKALLGYPPSRADRKGTPK